MALLPGDLHDFKIPDSDKDRLIALLSPEEKVLHTCLQGQLSEKEKYNCLKGSPLESSVGRIPSSDFMDKLQWFFSSQKNQLSFLKTFDGIRKAHEALKKSGRFFNSYGIGLNGEAHFGIGRSWIGELIRHNNQLALFCAPGVGAKTDIGVSAGFGVVRTISCRSNSHYGGNFLTVNAGASGEVIGLPVGVGLNYSFGVDLKIFKNEIQLARQNGRLNIRELSEEIQRLGSINSANLGKENSALLLFGAKLVSLAYPDVNYKGRFTTGHVSILKDSLLRKVSLGSAFRSFISSGSYRDFVRHHDLRNLEAYFDILGKSFSGCDSMGGGGALSLSLSPVSLGVSYTNYRLLYEFSPMDSKSLPRITPLMLLNPILFGPQELQFLSLHAKSMITLAQNIQNNCK